MLAFLDGLHVMQSLQTKNVTLGIVKIYIYIFIGISVPISVNASTWLTCRFTGALVRGGVDSATRPGIPAVFS